MGSLILSSTAGFLEIYLEENIFWKEGWKENEDYILAAGNDPATLRADRDRLGPAAVAAGRAMLAEWLSNLPDYYD